MRLGHGRAFRQQSFDVERDGFLKQALRSPGGGQFGRAGDTSKYLTPAALARFASGGSMP